MSEFVRLCKTCQSNSNENSSLRGCGYSTYLDEDKYICDVCGGREIVNLKMLSEDYNILTTISDNPVFIKSMIQLQEKDIIEYELKMSQFRNQVEWQKEKNQPHCPTCGSTNIKKISGLSKAGSVAIWGIFSRKVHKQWHCISCGTEW